MPKVLVTGGTGFVGQALLGALVAAGHPAPGLARWAACAKSPLTGGIGEARSNHRLVAVAHRALVQQRSVGDGHEVRHQLAGAGHHREAALVEMLKLPRKRVPHHCTFRRLLQNLEPAMFEQVVRDYQREHIPGERALVISIDGKTYDLATLGDEARTQILNLRITDQEIARLQRQMAIAQTARAAYARALQGALEKHQASH